jgi:hypothetical protein
MGPAVDAILHVNQTGVLQSNAQQTDIVEDLDHVVRHRELLVLGKHARATTHSGARQGRNKTLGEVISNRTDGQWEAGTGIVHGCVAQISPGHDALDWLVVSEGFHASSHVDHLFETVHVVKQRLGRTSHVLLRASHYVS